jgi:hypothetical protein
MDRKLLLTGLVAVSLFALYAACVQFMPLRVPAGQNQNDTNMIRAQAYLNAPVPPPIVLTGSSLTFRLPPEKLATPVANLGFAGDGAMTGVTLVEASGITSPLVLVEINRLMLPADHGKATLLLRFPERDLRRHFRVFRTGYDPVNLINLTYRGAAWLMHKSDYEAPPRTETMRLLTEVQRKTYAGEPDLTSLRANLRDLAALDAEWRRRGITLGFFEMPVDASLVDLPGVARVRQEVLRAFPPSRFCWLRLPASGHTVDGIHLTLEDAASVARLIRTESSSCLRNQKA